TPTSAFRTPTTSARTWLHSAIWRRTAVAANCRKRVRTSANRLQKAQVLERSPVAHGVVSRNTALGCLRSARALTGRNSETHEFGSKLSQRVVVTSLRVQPGK